MRYAFLTITLLLTMTAPAAAQDRQMPQSREQIQLSYAPLVKQVAPAVVNIYTKRIVSRKLVSPFANDPFFGQFFSDEFFGGRMRRQVENSLGSGVIIDPEGLIVTNAHVIQGAQEITIALADGREFEASLTLSDEASDLALLRINDAPEEELPFVNLKPSESLQVGDLVLAIGNPFGVGQTVTSGIVSAQGRSSLNINDFNFFIQTDAAINPGNSGGPLVALDGGVVGINTAIFSRTGGSLGIGFAIPSEMVASLVAAADMGRVGEQGVIRPWLGVSVQDLTPDIARSLGMERPAGVLIAGMHRESPLQEAGLKRGDLIVAVNGKEIRNLAELRFRMATVPLGERAEFAVLRDGRRLNVAVEAMAPPEDPPRETTRIEGSNPFRGAVIANINPAVMVELGVPEEKGVVVLETAPRSPAARIVRRGDLVLKINDRGIGEVDDMKKALSRSASTWSIILSRQGHTRQIVIR